MSSASEALRTGETTGRPSEAVDSETVADTVTEVVEADTAVAEGEATEEVEVVMRMEILTEEVAEEATIMGTAVEEVVQEGDGAETTEMTTTGMRAPTGAEGETEMAVETISQEATEEAEVITDILHEGYL